MNLDQVKKKHKASPISCWAGVLVMILGLAVSAAYVYQLFGGTKILSWQAVLALGPGLMLGGSILWSDAGSVIDLFFKWAQQKINGT